MTEELNKQIGIDSTILTMETAIEIATDIGKALDDKKLSLSESLAMVKHIPSVISLIKGAPQLPAELKNLSADEREVIVAHFADKFDLADDAAEARVEQLFRTVVVLAAETVAVIDLVKSLRTKE
jgi:hypothetical protein